MEKIIKAISLIGTLVIVLPIGMIAALTIPTYHPDHPTAWFLGTVIALSFVVSATMTSIMLDCRPSPTIEEKKV